MASISAWAVVQRLGQVVGARYDLAASHYDCPDRNLALFVS